MTAIEKFKAWCEAELASDPSASQTSIAKRLGIPQPSLSRILAESKDVTRDVAIAIERETNGDIQIEDWKGYVPAHRPGSAPRMASESGEHSVAGEHAPESA